jgi:hypothetical protein
VCPSLTIVTLGAMTKMGPERLLWLWATSCSMSFLRDSIA